MRKIVSLLSMLMLFSILAFGQTRTVSGVVRDQAGNPIPFATVTESGTTNATTADERGAFRITIGQNSRLVVSSSGFSAITLTPTDGDQTVTLAPTGNLQEVVVTALGIRRKPEEIGYATTKVRPEQITAGRNFNLAQSLSGKVSGLTITNTSASVNATPRIVLRGLRSLTGTNTALIVLDGVQVPSSTINFINPNDVESIDVLKGGQAATLFGSEGVNGAIVITTKKGSQRPEVTVQHTHNVESVAFLPDFNTEFGSGSAYGATPFENFHPAENQQYGDRYDGSIRPIGRRRADGSILLAPYSYDPGSRNGLFSTGNTGQTDFSYRSGDANSNFFVSYQNLFSNGIVAGDKYNRNSFRLNSTRTYGKVQIGFDANYVFDKADRANTDYYFFALNTPSWIPLDQLTDWRNDKYATMDGWFNDYYNAPTWLKDNQRFESRNTVFNGNVRLVFKPIEALEFTARAAITALGGTTTTESNSHRFSNWAARQAPVDFFNNNYDRFLTGLGRFVARTNLVGGIGESSSSGQRITGDLFGTYRKTFGNLDLTAILGTQAIATYDKSSSVSTNGIGIPELFNLGYSATGLFAGDNNRTETRKIGGFADVTVGFKRLAYLHASFRNDYTSRFYDSETGNNEIGYDDPSFLTYGVDASFIISDIVPTMRGRVVDNLKLRASYNQNGNDNLGAYQLRRIYPLAGGFPYSGLVGTTVGNTLVDNVLTPERVRTAEVGFELGLFANRLAFEGSYYTQSSDKQLLNVSTSAASGGTTYRLNAADLDNKGYELDVRANVFRSKDWNINLNANYSHNTNKVVNIYGETGLDRLNFQSSTNLNLVAEVGQMFPYLRTTAFLRDPNGRVVIDTTDGWPRRNEELVGKGTTLPIDVLGLGLNVAWKGLTLQANAEYRGGHLVYHDLGEDMTFTGSGAITTIYGRETFIWPNSVYEVTGSKYEANNKFAVGAYQAMYQGFGDQGFTRGLAGIGETYTTSAAFWKIRDISLSYEFPASVIGGVKFIRGITLTAFARNPFTWLPSDNIYTDPEFANTNGNAQGVNTSLNTPPTRQFGGVIRVIF